MKLNVTGWNNNGSIAAKYAFGKPGTDAPFAPSDNISPQINWTNPPEGTKSFALIVHDRDVPTKPDDVNQPDRQVPADLPRCDFFHWILIDIPASLSELPEGAGSTGIVAGGKPSGETPYGLTGKNDYTGWFSGDPEMEGIYGGYDGPCPPWNDSIVHHYTFTLYALSVSSLGLSGEFTGTDVIEAMNGQILDSAEYNGTYTMNPDVVTN